MKSKICNVLDLELQDKTIIEIGLTTIHLEKREILKTYSIPIWHENYPVKISPNISQLTGWTESKLKKSGITLTYACERIENNYGGKGRLLVVDSEDEPNAILNNLSWFGIKHVYPFGEDILNVSTLFKIKTKQFDNKSLIDMLSFYDIQFEGKLHRASDDSFNIAKLLLKLME